MPPKSGRDSGGGDDGTDADAGEARGTAVDKALRLRRPLGVLGLIGLHLRPGGGAVRAALSELRVEPLQRVDGGRERAGSPAGDRGRRGRGGGRGRLRAPEPERVHGPRGLEAGASDVVRSRRGGSGGGRGEGAVAGEVGPPVDRADVRQQRLHVGALDGPLLAPPVREDGDQGGLVGHLGGDAGRRDRRLDGGAGPEEGRQLQDAMEGELERKRPAEGDALVQVAEGRPGGRQRLGQAGHSAPVVPVGGVVGQHGPYRAPAVALAVVPFVVDGGELVGEDSAAQVHLLPALPGPARQELDVPEVVPDRLHLHQDLPVRLVPHGGLPASVAAGLVDGDVPAQPAPRVEVSEAVLRGRGALLPPGHVSVLPGEGHQAQGQLGKDVPLLPLESTGGGGINHHLQGRKVPEK